MGLSRGVRPAGLLLLLAIAVGIPVSFFPGRHDYVSPWALAVECLRKLDAPEKDVHRFEESAHLPSFEEPAAFAEALTDVKRRVLAGGR